MNIRKILFVQFFIFHVLSSNSQTLPVGFPILEDYARRSQLMGNFDSTVSFSLRPLAIDNFKDSLLAKHARWFGKDLNEDGSGKKNLKLLPLQFKSELNTNYPYGWNNGSMLRSRGFQTLLSGGVYGKLGILSLQLKPELVYVQNKDFDGFPDSFDDSLWGTRYVFTWNRIDTPERFGGNSLHRILPGQSSIRLNYGSFSFGVSTENLWWGPGKNHSLIMTNNASGFPHLTLNTLRPAKTPIGTVELQLIAGRLENSNFDPPLPERGAQSNWIRPKRTEWRYLNGIVIVYNPKWVNGLSLGATRVVQNYHDSTRIKKEYLPVFSNFFRERDNNQFFDGSRDQLLSIFFRWVWIEAKAEIYVEFGRSDASWNFRDFLLSPEHSTSYIFGFSKIIPISQKNHHLEVLFETTHLELSKTGTLRQEPGWYLNGRNAQGYTNMGEILGAGIGTGSNLQYLSLKWHKGLRNLGFFAERLVNDNDFYFRSFGSDPSRNWINLSFGINGTKSFKNFLMEGKIQYVRSKNHQWEFERNISNLFTSVNLTYSL